MKRIIVIMFAVFLLSAFLTGCAKEVPIEQQIANPSATFCEEKGGTYEIIDTPEGQSGNCIINGEVCEGWAFYRGECGN